MICCMSRKNKAKPQNNDKASPKKKRGGMSDVLKESVPEAALDIFRQNDDFIVETDEGDKYIGIYVTAEDLGGLSKKDRKNESKGQIIEGIVSGQISAYITADMLRDEQILFIPNDATIDRMNEYSLLRSAPFKLALVDSDGDVEFTNKTVSLSLFVDILNDDVSISTLMNMFNDTESVDTPVDDVQDADDTNFDVDAEEGSDFAGGYNPTDEYDEYEVPSDEDDDEEVVDDAENVNPDDIFGAGPDDFEPSGYSSPTEEQPIYDAPENEIVDDSGFDEDIDTAFEDDMAEGAEDNGEEPVDVVGDETMVMNTISRKFYSDDLGLEISSEPFDLQFLSHDTFVPFNENRPAGWLNDYLNQMSNDANIEMKHLHVQNLQILRERFLSLLSLHFESIERQLDTESENTHYGNIMLQIVQQRQQELSGVKRKVSEETDRINKAWNEKLDAIRAEAADQAVRVYKDRYGESHQAELLRVESDIKDEIERSTNEMKRQLHEDRRKEAARLFDMGINEILVQISGMYVQMVEEENLHRKELQANIQTFIDNNRKDEIARAQALADELAQSEKADRVSKEYTEKLKAQTAEFKAKREADLADIARIREEQSKLLADKEYENNKTVADLQKQIEAVKADRDRLMESYVKLDEERKSEYEGRINQLTQDKIAVEENLAHVTATHKRSGRMAIVAAIVAVIAALAIGIVGGYYAGTRIAEDVSSNIDAKYRNQIPSEAATIALEGGEGASGQSRNSSVVSGASET